MGLSLVQAYTYLATTLARFLRIFKWILCTIKELLNTHLRASTVKEVCMCGIGGNTTETSLYKLHTTPDF